MIRKGRDGMAYLNREKREVQSPELMEKKPGKCLNDYVEISIGGVVYRVKSVFADKGQMGELLDLAVMEKLSRIA